MATFSVKDFSGGKTDFPISAEPSQFQEGDNLIINEYNDSESRPGTLFDFTDSMSRARVGNEKRIGLMCPQYTGSSKDFTIIKQAEKKLFYDNGSAMTELVGPASASAFDITNMTDEVAFSYGEWNEHTIITHESPYQIPVKVYRNGSGALTLRTAGLPPVAGSGFTATSAAGGASYGYALVHKYTYQVGSTEYVDRSRPYIKEFTSLANDPSANNVTVGSIPVLANSTGEHYDTSAIKIEIYRTTDGGSVFYYVGEVTNGTTSFVDNSSNTTIQNAGVTLYTTGGVLENDRPPKSKYVHSTSDFTYYGHGYEVSTTGSDNEFLAQRIWQSKRGDPDSVPATFYADIEEPITGISSIKSIPIVFGANSVYRLDGSFDAFGRGGLLPRKISDRVGCVGHLSIVQTMDGLYFAGNDGFYFTDGYKIYSISAEDFKKTYSRLIDTELNRKRIYGAYDAKNKRILWSTFNDDGDTFEENNQIFCMYLPTKKFTTWSSGYRGESYYFDTDSAVYDSGTQTFTVGSNATVDVGDIMQVYDASTNESKVLVNLIAYQKPNSTDIVVSFGNQVPTLASSTYRLIAFRAGENEVNYYGNFQPSSLLYANNILWQGDGRGFTLKYDTDTLSDVVPIIGVTPVTVEDNGTVAVMTAYKSAFMDLGTTEYRKWVNSVILKFRPRVDVATVCAVTPYGENDDNNSPDQLKDVYEVGFYRWGSLTYGDPALYRRRQQVLDAMRRFPKNGLRCEYKQLHLRNAFVNIYNSDVYGEGEITTSTGGYKIMQVPNELSDYPYGYWIYFESDDYTQGYYVGSQYSIASNDYILFFDPAGTAPALASTGNKWVIKGYPTNNFINLIEYTLNYEILGSSQTVYRGATGENAS